MTAPTTLAPDPIRWAITRALAELVALGTVEAVAAHLERLEIRAVCGNPGQCAIALYLDRQIPAVRWAVLYVDQTQVDVSMLPDREPDDRETVRMPALLGAFVRRFDAGDFPGLLAADSPRSAPQPF